MQVNYVYYLLNVSYLLYSISFAVCSEKQEKNSLRQLTSALDTPTVYLPPTNFKIQFDYNERTWPKLCTTGKLQSPILLPSDFKVLDKESRYIQFLDIAYNETLDGQSLQAQTSEDDKTNSSFMYLDVKDKGYFKLRINEKVYRYNISHIDFIFPPEHNFDGITADLEMQIAHVKDYDYQDENSTDYDDDPYENNTKLIVSVLFEATAPNPNKDLQNLRVSSAGAVYKFDAEKYLPKGQNFMFYEGSLTKPPCTEDVFWIVAVKKHYMNKDQLNEFAGWYIDSGYSTKGGARSVKPLNGRKVYYQYHYINGDEDSARVIKLIYILTLIISIVLL